MPSAPKLPAVPAAPPDPPPPPQLSASLQAATNQRNAAAAAAGKGFGGTVLTMPQPLLSTDQNNVTSAKNKLLGAGNAQGGGFGVAP